MHIVWNLSLLFSFPLSDYLQPVLLCVLKTFTSFQNRKKPSLTPYCPSSSTTLYFPLFRQTPLSSSATFTARALPPLTQQHHNSASSCSTAGLTKVSSDLHVNKSNECSQFLCNLILYLTLLLTTTLKLPWLVIFFVFPCRHLLSLLVRSATFNWSLNDGVPMTLPCPKHSPLSTPPIRWYSIHSPNIDMCWAFTMSQAFDRHWEQGWARQTWFLLLFTCWEEERQWASDKKCAQSYLKVLVATKICNRGKWGRGSRTGVPEQ